MLAGRSVALYSPSMGIDLLHELRQRIVSSEFSPGDTLNEKQLAEEYDVSRTPIRDALIRLEGESLVGKTPGRGFFVKTVTVKEFREILEIRLHLCELVGRLVAERITPAELDAFRTLHVEILVGEGLKALLYHDSQFHRLVDGATHNEALIRQQTQLVNQFARVRLSLVAVDEALHFRPLRDDVEKFIAAAERRDAAACTQVLQDHLRRFVATVLDISPQGET